MQLRTPRQQAPNIEKLREALLQRAAQWKADLRDEPQVARMLLRRLVGPLTLWDALSRTPPSSSGRPPEVPRIAFDGKYVTFSGKDYARGNQSRTMTLTAIEFR